MEAQNTRHTNPMIVVAVVALMSFMGILTETSMNVTFPALMKEFHVPPQHGSVGDRRILIDGCFSNVNVGLHETSVY